MLAGPPGGGKTTLAGEMAAIVSRGGFWPDGLRAQQGDVVIWTGEDDPEDTLVPRLIASGACLQGIHFVGNVRDEGASRSFDPAKDMAELSKGNRAVWKRRARYHRSYRNGGDEGFASQRGNSSRPPAGRRSLPDDRSGCARHSSLSERDGWARAPGAFDRFNSVRGYASCCHDRHEAPDRRPGGERASCS